MSAHQSESDDRAIGLSLAFGALATLAAVYMVVAATQLGRALGFAAAVAVSLLAVAAIHVYA